MRILLASTFAVLLAMPAVAQIDPYMQTPGANRPADSSIQDSDDDDNVWQGAVESQNGSAIDAAPADDELLLQGRSSVEEPLPEDTGSSDSSGDSVQSNPDDDSGMGGPDGSDSSD